MNERAARVKRAFQIPVLLAALLSIPVVIIDNGADSAAWRDFGVILNWVSWGAFVVEYVVMMFLVSDRWGYTKRNILDVIVIVGSFPMYLPEFALLRLLRLNNLGAALRAAKWMRPAAALGRAGRISQSIFDSFGLRYIATLIVVLALSFGAIFWIAEPDVENYPEAMWWAIVTITTVGYGDVVPVTTLGRIAGVGLMVMGIGFVATLTAMVATHFVGATHTTREDAEEIAVRLASLEDQIERITQMLTSRDDPPGSAGTRSSGPPR